MRCARYWSGMLAKRAFDIAAAAVGLVVLAVPILLIALWVRLESPGPAFYRQVRVGRYGRDFRLFKFRTMVTDADRIGDALTVGDDPRVTRAGRFLRDTKLDELPQLFNVLRGEMSFVGPRPEVPEFVAHYSDQERNEVMSVRPGLTDEAAIVFRHESRLLAGQADAKRYYVESILPEKIRLYREYVRQRTFVARREADLQDAARNPVAQLIAQRGGE